MVLPVPLEARTTVAPLIGFENWSRTVAVMVDWLAPLLAVIVVGRAARSEAAALTGPAVTVTDAVWVTRTLPFTVALIVFASAVVEEKLAVKTPLPFVVPLAAGLKLLPLPVELSTTAAPGIRFEKVSRTVTVMSDVLVPLDAVMEATDAEAEDLLPAGVVFGMMLNGALVAPVSEPEPAVRV